MSRISLNQVESSERFYRIPKVFTDENSYYCTMRLESKFAYGLLKDRFELSIKNKWVDKEKNIYLIFTVKELEKVLGCKKDKVHQIKRELAQYGLLEEERQGLNKPNRIYVLNIDTMRTSEKPTSNEARDLFFGDWRDAYEKFQSLPTSASEYLSENSSRLINKTIQKRVSHTKIAQRLR